MSTVELSYTPPSPVSCSAALALRLNEPQSVFAHMIPRLSYAAAHPSMHNYFTADIVEFLQ